MFQSEKGGSNSSFRCLGSDLKLVVDGLHLHEKGDHGVMGVDASAGAAVGRPALRLAPHENRALVRPYDLHARRLADDPVAQAVDGQEFGPFADFGRAPAPDFLVGGEHEIDRGGEFRRLEGRPRRQHGRQGAFHVAASAAVYPVITDLGRKRVRLPAVHRNGVRMAQQREAALPLALAADEVDLIHTVVVLVGDALDLETDAVELVLKVIGDGGVAVGADRVEGDQLPGDLEGIEHRLKPAFFCGRMPEVELQLRGKV